jgi:hypothetical protein
MTPTEARALLTRCENCRGIGGMQTGCYGVAPCRDCSGSGLSPEREEALRLLLREEREDEDWIADAQADVDDALKYVVAAKPVMAAKFLRAALARLRKARAIRARQEEPESAKLPEK